MNTYCPLLFLFFLGVIWLFLNSFVVATWFLSTFIRSLFLFEHILVINLRTNLPHSLVRGGFFVIGLSDVNITLLAATRGFRRSPSRFKVCCSDVWYDKYVFDVVLTFGVFMRMLKSLSIFKS